MFILLRNMCQNLKYILKYIIYYLFSGHGKGYGIHSPFIYEYITNVLTDRTIDRKMKEINDFSSELRSDKAKINATGLVQDHILVKGIM